MLVGEGIAVVVGVLVINMVLGVTVGQMGAMVIGASTRLGVAALGRTSPAITCPSLLSPREGAASSIIIQVMSTGGVGEEESWWGVVDPLGGFSRDGVIRVRGMVGAGTGAAELCPVSYCWRCLIRRNNSYWN